MTTEELTLWNKLESFKLDDNLSTLTFSARLARENGWTIDYTHRVIEEYKKFIFLCCVSPGGVTPSDPVDQAWHLHLTYTKSYWTDLCRDTLGQEIHHTPTKGGDTEADKFDGYYTSSQKIYTDKFGTPPPADIWHDNETRFSDINFQRVNLKEYKLVKPWLFTTFKIAAYSILIIISFVVAAIIDVYTGKNFFFPITVFLTVIILWNKQKGSQNRDNGSGCGGDASWGDNDSGHHSGGHGGHGSSSGCSGCSGSGCSGCGGGCGD